MLDRSMRPDGRRPDELRPVTFERDFTEMTPGSVLVSFGRTRVLCNPRGYPDESRVNGFDEQLIVEV